MNSLSSKTIFNTEWGCYWILTHANKSCWDEKVDTTDLLSLAIWWVCVQINAISIAVGDEKYFKYLSNPFHQFQWTPPFSKFAIHVAILYIHPYLTSFCLQMFQHVKCRTLNRCSATRCLRLKLFDSNFADLVPGVAIMQKSALI